MSGPPPQHTERVALDIAVGSEPIQGRIEDAGGRRAFFGWIELIRSIEAIARRRDEPAGPDG